MGQIEIFETLRDRRASGDDSFFTIKQIRKMLRDQKKIENCNTGIQSAQLEAFGYLEAKRITKRSDHWRAFRVKFEYMKDKN